LLRDFVCFLTLTNPYPHPTCMMSCKNLNCSFLFRNIIYVLPPSRAKQLWMMMKKTWFFLRFDVEPCLDTFHVSLFSRIFFSFHSLLFIYLYIYIYIYIICLDSRQFTTSGYSSRGSSYADFETSWGQTTHENGKGSSQVYRLRYSTEGLLRHFIFSSFFFVYFFVRAWETERDEERERKSDRENCSY
jgi:hypothetical protein